MHTLAVARLDDPLMLALGRALNHLHPVQTELLTAVSIKPLVSSTCPAVYHTPLLFGIIT